MLRGTQHRRKNSPGSDILDIFTIVEWFMILFANRIFGFIDSATKLF